MEAVRFDKHDVILDQSPTYEVDASSVGGTVGPGWTLPLVEDLGIKPPPKGGFLIVSVSGELEVDLHGEGIVDRAELGWSSE